MAIKKFSKKEALQFGWQAMKKNFWFFAGVLIVTGLVSWAPGALSDLTEKDLAIFSIIIGIAGWALQTVVQMGLIKIALNLHDNKERKFSDLFSCFRLFFRYIFSSILYGLIVLGGFILLIVPGIIWAIKFQFFGYFIVDKGTGPAEALKRSSAITQGAKWDLFLLGLLLGLINLLGVLCLILGLFATVPTSMVARAFVYRKLLSYVESPQSP
jgi:hypothetical protein